MSKEDFAGIYVVDDSKIYIGPFQKPKTIKVLTTRSLESDGNFRVVISLHNDQDTMLNHIVFKSNAPMDAYIAHRELVKAITAVNANRMITDIPVSVLAVNEAFDKISYEIKSRFPKKEGGF